MSFFPDVITKSLAFVLGSFWFLFALDWRFLAFAFCFAAVAAARSKVPWSFVNVSFAAPALPILVSHFGIEPLLGDYPIEGEVVVRAVEAWLRLVGMILLSLAWVRSLDFFAVCGLARLVGISQVLFVALIFSWTNLQTVRNRWIAIRESNSLKRTGILANRRLISLRQIPSTGLQLSMSSLLNSSGISLGCEGRGIGSRRKLAVFPPRLSALGVFTTTAMTMLTFIALLYGYLRF